MKNGKKENCKSKSLLNILLSIMIFFGLGQASSVSAFETEFNLENTNEYSEPYKEWLNLSEEERKRVPEPDKYLQEFVPSSKLAVNFNTFSPVLKANVLPDTYDLRNVDGVNYVTAVKNQGNLGLCWAFSATSVLETSIMINQLGNYELDPVHVTHIRYKSFSDYSNPISVDRELNAGGNFEDALHYWTSGQGPVLETSFSGNGKEPLTAKETLIDTVDVQLDAAYQLPSLDLNNSTSADLDEFINLIKKTIMQYGAIYFGGASPQPLSGNLSNGYKCGNPYNYSYDSVYTDNVNDYFCSPHAMTIIGWDDNFSKDNFKAGLTSGKKPTRDGAWIVKNSWGTRNGDEGYYYYSYEDYNLNRNSLWVVSEVSKREYDRIYSYDLISLNTSNINKNVDTYAVVFDKTNNTEILDEVSFRIVGNGDSIGYDIYVNAEDGNIDSDSFQLVKSASDAFDYNGYYTVKLNNPVELTGEQFVVKLKLKNAYLVMSGAGKGYPGQNYLLTTNGWEDIFKTSDVKTLQLKTFTKNKQSNSEIQASTFVKYTANKYGDINLRTVTNNIPKASTLDYVIKDISGNDITNKFSVEKGIVVNDTAITSISAIAAIPSGNYQIDTLYNGVILDSTVFKMSEILKISDLQYEPFNNGEIGTITLKAYNVADNKYNLIIENSAGKEVTGLFSINQSSIIDNTVTITIMNSVITPADEYTVCVEDLKHNLNHERTFIINSKDSDAKKISLSEVISTPDIFYEGNTGTFLLSANLENIDDDYVKISIYDKNNEVITNKFVVTGSEFTNNEILVDVKNNQVNIQIGVSKQSEVAAGIYRVDVSDVNNEAFAETYFSIRKAGTNIQITNFAMTSELIYSNEIASGSFNISTQGITGEHLNLFIKNDKQEMVTDLFSINSSGTSSTVVNNVASVMLPNDKTANISFNSKQSLPSGEYTILVTDENSQIIDLVSFSIEQYIYVEGIVFNKQGDVFRPMGYKLIEPIVVPFNANNQNVSFYSSNKSVASVTKSGKVGIVDAWSRGTTIIIAESEEGNFTADYLVTVIEPTITVGETVLQSNYNNKLYEGYGGKVITDITSQDVSDGKILGITITDEQDNDVTENFEISGATVLENAAKIEISVLPNIKIGTYQVTVSESRLVSEQYSFVVEAPTLVSEIKVKDEELEVGEEKQLEVEILPDNALNKKLKYETSDENIVSVDETGKVTAHKGGSVTITITSEDGNASAECEVIVTSSDIGIALKDISSYKITIEGENKYIENIVLLQDNVGIQSLTREQFVSQFESFGAEIYEQDGITKVENNDAIMKTGMIVRNNNEEYYVIIKGDATGDGKINSSDALKIRRYIIGIGEI